MRKKASAFSRHNKKVAHPSLIRRMQQEAQNRYNDLSERHLSNLTNYRWLRYVIAFWVFRMAFVVIGFMFPILALFSSSPKEMVSFDLQSTSWGESNKSFIRKLMSSESPFLFVDVPVPESSSITSLLLTSMPSLVSNVKQSKSGHFVYYSADQQWSPNISNLADYDITNMTSESLLYQLGEAHLEEGEESVYVSQLLHSPESNSILLSLAPYMMQFPPATKTVFPEYRLWLSSRNVTVAPHYDMEHNFFLQVNGTKTFFIAAPSLTGLYEPFSVLHPHWRQSQHHADLISVDSTLNYLRRLSDPCNVSASIASTTTPSTQHDNQASNIKVLHWDKKCGFDFTVSEETSRKIRRRKKESDGPVDAAALTEGHGKDSSRSDFNHYGNAYEVTLQPGQMLYIPPFYFHAVTSHAHSVSLNTWIGSRYLLATDVLKNIDLPYRQQSDALAQLSGLTAMVKMVWLDLNNVADMPFFADMMRTRHGKVKFDVRNNKCYSVEMIGDDDEVGYCGAIRDSSEAIQLPKCNLKSLRRAEQERVVRRSAKSVSNALSAFPLSIKVTMLMDYVDDIFDLIAIEAAGVSDPNHMISFISSCLDVQNYF